jgi:signal transduction histidine kinase/ligand-binding sensor domain-containing protein
MSFGYLPNDVGLAIAGHHCIIQDSRGFIWFGGDNGLYRYDGYELKAYLHDPGDENSIGATPVNWICEDRSGVLWVAVSDAGLDRFDRRTGHFTHYRHDHADSASLSDNAVHAIIQSHDRILWTGGLSGADEFDPEQPVFKHHQPNPWETGTFNFHDVATLYEDRSGTLWLGMWGGGLNEYDRMSNTFRHYRHSASDPSSLSDDRVHSICETSDGRLWVGTWGGGLDVFDRRTNHFLHFWHKPGVPHSLSDNSITSILQTSDGRLWVGTWNGGLNLFEARSGTFRCYKYDPLLRNSLCDNKITSLCEDRNGILWIGSRGGVNFLDTRRKPFAYQKTKPPDLHMIENDFVSSIVRDNVGRLWVGTLGGGVDRFDFSAKAYRHFGHSIHDPGSLVDDAVSSICQDASGTIWIGTGSALDRLDKGERQFTHFWPDLADSNSLRWQGIAALAADLTGVLWIGLNMAGVDEYDETQRHFSHHKHSATDPYSLSNDLVRTVYVDRRGTPWIGTATEGLDMYDKAGRKFVHHIHDPQNSTTLNSNDIRAIYEDGSGRFWVRTEKGLDQMDRETGVCIHCTTGDEISPQLCASLEEDSEGNLWFSTKTGIAKLNPRTLAKRLYGLPDDLEIHNFQDLLQGGTTGQQRLFLGTLRGLLAFSPDSIRDNVAVPPVVITSFTLAGKDLLPDPAVAEKAELLLAAQINAFSLEFAALDFVEPRKNQYAYKLEGFDRDWIFCGSRRYVSYTNLEGGNYIFRVKGSNSDGIWNEAGASISIKVQRPYWKTWWFTVGAWVLLGLTLAGGVRFVEITRLRRRLKALEQQHVLERERTRISQDMHDEVGAGLTEIGILSELAKRNIRNPQEAEIQMQRVSETSRETIASIGEIIWAINPKNDLLDDLVAYLRHYTARYLGPTGITLEFDIPETIPDFHFSAESRRNIFLVMKETLHNIVKHSEATAVVIKVAFTKEHLDILVKDNGKGFSASDTSRFGNGLHNMEKRMKTIGGGFVIESSPGEGTSVAIGLKL